MSEKKESRRTYRVRQDLGEGKFKTTIVVASTQAQARGYVTRKTISVEPISGLEVADLVATGVAIEHAVESAAEPEQTSIE